MHKNPHCAPSIPWMQEVPNEGTRDKGTCKSTDIPTFVQPHKKSLRAWKTCRPSVHTEREGETVARTPLKWQREKVLGGKARKKVEGFVVNAECVW